LPIEGSGGNLGKTGGRDLPRNPGISDPESIDAGLAAA